MDMALKRARTYVRLDQPKKAEGSFQSAITARPNNADVWIARGRTFAELGWKDRADADFTKAAALTPEELDRFPQAGWWVIGPYNKDLTVPCPPEKDPDPSRPVARIRKSEQLHWRPAPTEPNGRVDLRTIFNVDHGSAYALTYVYSPEERTATLLVGGDDRVRVWLNGRLVHETNGTLDNPWWNLDRVPVTLKAGRNTLLCKISQEIGPHCLYLRIADNPFDRAYLHAQLGLWDEAAAEFACGIDRQRNAFPEHYVRCAHAHALLGDTAGYRSYVALMFKRYDKDSPPYDWLAYAGGLWEGAVETKRLLELAEHALEHDNAPWWFHVAGIAHYRAGQFEKAIGRLQESLKNPGWQSGPGHASELGIALAHHRLGHAQEARQWLDKAEQWYDKAVQDALASPYGRATLYHWPEWPSFVVLRREAHKVILGKELPDDPRLKKLADRMRDWLKKRDKATADYDVAILLSPNEPRLYLARARRLVELKRTKEAEADLAKIEAFGDKAKEALLTELAGSEADKFFAQLGDDAALPWLTAAVKRSPEDMESRKKRAEWYARHRRWKEAAADFQIWLKRQPAENRSMHDAWQWLHAAPLFVAAGDHEGYRRLRREMLKRFGETQDLWAAERITKACLLIPESAKESEPACRLADRAFALGKKHPPALYFIFCKGLADYRRGNWRAAIEELDPIVPQLAGDRYVSTFCHLVLAMALHQQGETKAAREHLTQAAKLLGKYVPDLARFPQFPESRYDHDWLFAWLLNREAQTLIEGKKAEPKK
jgi:tetratricopeptide (TPR) repeat protein